MTLMSFSNDRLNFKHAFWASAGQQKGIFGATTRYFTRPGA
jgi:hypothetical protein